MKCAPGSATIVSGRLPTCCRVRFRPEAEDQSAAIRAGWSTGIVDAGTSDIGSVGVFKARSTSSSSDIGSRHSTTNHLARTGSGHPAQKSISVFSSFSWVRPCASRLAASDPEQPFTDYTLCWAKTAGFVLLIRSHSAGSSPTRRPIALPIDVRDVLQRLKRRIDSRLRIRV